MPLILKIRKQLALPKASWQLCLLAMIGGCMSALFVVLFLTTIDAIKAFYGAYFINYNSLNTASRMLMPISGAVIIILLWKVIGEKHTKIGIPFVLHQLTMSNGSIPLRNTVNQFLGASVAIASGFSVGKEGPSVHLGAACSSFIGSKLNLPFNTINTLSACCIAAAIAACFNTPITAVVFVITVILREYKAHSLIPIMLAAIIGSLVTSQIFGDAHQFTFFTQFTLAISHYPYLIIFGVILGVAASTFNYSLTLIMKQVRCISLIPRLISAAIITGVLSHLLPYAFTDNITQISLALTEQWPLALIAFALLAKVCMTIIALGLGIPGGVIGPILSIGALMGMIAAFSITYITGDITITSNFALMGMAGFMAATLSAPLVALFAMVELSSQFSVIVPAIIVITTSYLVSNQLLRNQAIFIMQLDALSMPCDKTPIEQTLEKVAVLNVMNEDFILYNKYTIKQKNSVQHSSQKNTALYVSENKNKGIHQFYWHETIENKEEYKDKKPNINIRKLIPLHSQATLKEVYTELISTKNSAIYIYDKTPNIIIGIITFEQINQYLNEGKLTQ